ncbi:MAG: HAMP domain-containing protein [Caldilineaceae bacterium]|nr:HAMP domain-containing protein [Caldilineaceae bacterium]
MWLFLGLVPVLLILLLFAGLSGYVVHSRFQADRILEAVIEETSTIHTLQVHVRELLEMIELHTTQQTPQHEIVSPFAVIDDVEQLFYQALSLCDEAEEQALLTLMIRRWDTIHSLIEQLPLAEQEADLSTIGNIRSAVVTEAYAILSGLDELQELVSTEAVETAAVTRFTGMRIIGLLGLTFLFLIVSLSALWLFFSRMITFPLETLRVGVEQLRQGDLNYRLRLDRNDDLGVIAQAVNELVDNLQYNVQQRVSRTTGNPSVTLSETTNLQNVLTYAVEVQEAERKRVAMDIHDGVSQWLTGTFLKLETTCLQLQHEAPVAIPQLKEAQALLQRAKIELKRTVQGLHPHWLEQGTLVDAIRLYLVELQRYGVIDCILVVNGMEVRLPKKSELALFRVVQEGINNVIKHAGTDSAILTLTYRSDRLQLLLADTGKGFDLQAFRHQPGCNLGLLSMSERISAVHGQFFIESKPACGTNIIVEIPIKATVRIVAQEQELWDKCNDSYQDHVGRGPSCRPSRCEELVEP